MKTFFLTSAYLAPVQYYSKLANFPVVLEVNDNYLKQTYRNRCNILTTNGIKTISIPIEKSGKLKTSMKEVKISYTENWQKLHWKTITSAYNSSPFFEYYLDDLAPFYYKKWTYLLDFNNEIQDKMIDLLNLDVDITHTAFYQTEFQENELDYRELIHPKKKVLDQYFKSQAYYQVFSQKHTFVPHLSIIDLLFNMGNESLLVLKNSINS